MKKRKAILGLVVCADLLISVGSISENVSSNAGYAVSRSMGGGAQAFATGAGGAAGGLAASWAGAKIGGKIGGIVGGPVGIILGAGLGAL